MRYVLNLVAVAAFAVAATLMVGCDTAKTEDTTPAAETGTSSAQPEAPASDALAGNVSKVSFTVTGMN